MKLQYAYVDECLAMVGPMPCDKNMVAMSKTISWCAVIVKPNTALFQRKNIPCIILHIHGSHVNTDNYALHSMVCASCNWIFGKREDECIMIGWRTNFAITFQWYDFSSCKDHLPFRFHLPYQTNYPGFGFVNWISFISWQCHIINLIF